MTDEIPQWALERAAQLANKEAGVTGGFTAAYMTEADLGRAFARYIAQHEQPPVDPLLIEAREIAAKYYDGVCRYNTAEACRNGKWDGAPSVQLALAALRRGIELGKAGAA